MERFRWGVDEDEAVDELKLTEGMEAYASIKASDVMVGIE